MKVYNKVVLDIETWKVVEEDSFEYEGPVCEAKGGGGGGSSGKVDFPEYMKNAHMEWISRAVTNPAGTYLVEGDSVTELILAGLHNSPYSGEVAYDPDDDISAFLAALVDFDSEIDDIVTTWVTTLATARSESSTVVTDATTAHAALLDDRLTTEVLPRFQAGMRDVNAVISSSFVLGQAVLEAFNTRDVAEFSARLRLQKEADGLELVRMKMSFKDSITKTIVEARRIKAVLKKEELDEQIALDEKEYRWPLELYQHGANMLSSISGSAVSVPDKVQRPSTLGGVLSGAASGAMLGTASTIPGGTLIGAGLGAILGGFLS